MNFDRAQEGGIPQCHRNALSYLQKLFVVNRGLCQEVTRESFMFLAPSGMPDSYCKMQRATFLLPIAEVVAKTAPSDVNPNENEVEKAAETQGRLTYTIETRGLVYVGDLWRHT